MFGMKLHGHQRQLAVMRVSATNERFMNLHGLEQMMPAAERGSTTRSNVRIPENPRPLLIDSQFRGPLRVVDPRYNRNQAVETAACAAVAEERNRLAREIHDTLVQEFAGIVLHLEAVSRLDKAENASECLACAKELAKCGLEDARRMLLGLRPKSLEGARLSEALRQLAEHFSRDCGIHCTLDVSGRSHQLPEETENELYRVAQEALCNVRKHSRAASVSILLSYKNGGVVLAIKDNGRGFVMAQPEAGAHGFGLPAMRDRADRLGGAISINTVPGTGTEVRMRVPLSGKNPQRKE